MARLEAIPQYTVKPFSAKEAVGTAVDVRGAQIRQDIAQAQETRAEALQPASLRFKEAQAGEQEARTAKFLEESNLRSMVAGAQEIRPLMEEQLSLTTQFQKSPSAQLQQAIDDNRMKQDQFLQKRQEGILARGGDVSETNEILAMGPEDRISTIANVLKIGREQKLIDVPTVTKAPLARAKIDLKTKKQVHVTDAQLLAEPTRYIDVPKAGKAKEFSKELIVTQKLIDEGIATQDMLGQKRAVTYKRGEPALLGGLIEEAETLPAHMGASTKLLVPTEEKPILPAAPVTDLSTPMSAFTPLVDKRAPRPVRSIIERDVREKESITLSGKSADRVASLRTYDSTLIGWGRALMAGEAYAKGTLAGTGKVATLGGMLSGLPGYEDLESLESEYSKLEMEKVKEVAAEAGARSMDSNAERAALRRTVPAIDKDDVTNRMLVVGGLALSKRAQLFEFEKNQWIDKYGTLNNFRSNAFNGAKTLVLFDKNNAIGSEPIIIPKSELKMWKDKGYVKTDRYIKLLKAYQIPTVVADDYQSPVKDMVQPDTIGTEGTKSINAKIIKWTDL